MARISEEEWAKIAKGFKVGGIATPLKARKGSKYKARPVVVTKDRRMVPAEDAKAQGLAGIRFDSTHEARYYVGLLGRVEDNEITGLVLQPSYDIHAANGAKVATYVADFRYVDIATGAVVVVDAKGMKTDIYRLKKKLVEAEHGITIREV
jgi:hypothetical protein